jgi:hypothetical protein
MTKRFEVTQIQSQIRPCRPLLFVMHMQCWRMFAARKAMFTVWFLVELDKSKSFPCSAVEEPLFIRGLGFSVGPDLSCERLVSRYRIRQVAAPVQLSFLLPVSIL